MQGLADSGRTVDAPVDSGGNAPRNAFRRNLIAWAAANSIGLSVALSVPLWISDFAGRFGLPPWSGGVAATLEMAMAAAANILWASISPQYPSRWTVVCLIMAIAAGQQLVASASPLLAFAGLVVAGGSSGCLLSVLNGQVALSRTPHHGYALLTFLHVGYGVALYIVAPRIQAQFGSNALFHLLCAIAILGSPLMWFLPAGPARLRPEHSQAAGPVSRFGIIGLIGVASLLTGHEAITAYMVLLGKPLNLTLIDVSGIMAAASTIGLVGPVLAGTIPARFGYLTLILPACVAMALIDIAMHFATAQAMFAIFYIALQTLLVFTVPRMLSYLAVIDPSGRSAGMAPAAILIGSSFGPLLGNFVGAPASGELLPFAAASTAAVTFVLFAAAGIRRVPPISLRRQ